MSSKNYLAYTTRDWGGLISRPIASPVISQGICGRGRRGTTTAGGARRPAQRGRLLQPGDHRDRARRDAALGLRRARAPAGRGRPLPRAIRLATLRQLTAPAVFLVALPLVLLHPYVAMAAWAAIY